MAISSRTPEDEPLRCEVCGAVVAVETADAGDTLCPACGKLLWAFKQHLADQLNLPLNQIDLTTFDDLAGDSLDLVEFVMNLEDEYGLILDPSEIEGTTSIRHLIVLIRNRQRGQEDNDAGCTSSSHAPFHLQLDQAVHFDGVFHREFFDERIDEAAVPQEDSDVSRWARLATCNSAQVTIRLLSNS